MTDVRLRRSDEPIDVIVGRTGELFGRGQFRRKPVDLRNIKDGVAAQHRNLPSLIIVVTFQRQPFCEDDVGAFLALAHMGVERERLLKGHPSVVDISSAPCCVPEHWNVDAAIGAPGGEIRGKQSEAGASFGFPRLNPNRNALFEVGDDVPRDAVIKGSHLHDGLLNQLGEHECGLDSARATNFAPSAILIRLRLAGIIAVLIDANSWRDRFVCGALNKVGDIRQACDLRKLQELCSSLYQCHGTTPSGWRRPKIRASRSRTEA